MSEESYEQALQDIEDHFTDHNFTNQAVCGEALPEDSESYCYGVMLVLGFNFIQQIIFTRNPDEDVPLNCPRISAPTTAMNL
jgi:hypothetical protein